MSYSRIANSSLDSHEDLWPSVNLPRSYRWCGAAVYNDYWLQTTVIMLGIVVLMWYTAMSLYRRVGIKRRPRLLTDCFIRAVPEHDRSVFTCSFLFIFQMNLYLTCFSSIDLCITYTVLVVFYTIIGTLNRKPSTVQILSRSLMFSNEPMLTFKFMDLNENTANIYVVEKHWLNMSWC